MSLASAIEWRVARARHGGEIRLLLIKDATNRRRTIDAENGCRALKSRHNRGAPVAGIQYEAAAGDWSMKRC